MSTITAIATPNATGGISVIRISGEKAVEIADRVFRSISEKPVAQMKAYTCAYGYVFENGEAVDDVVLTLFKAPRSYTGEDVVEISCHGGIYITRKILRIILDNGAELAKAGEFTKRAFLNGKLSLTQAEAVMDIISATGNNELKYASSLHDGAIFRRIKGICNEIVHILGDLSAWADYPEEGYRSRFDHATEKAVPGYYEVILDDYGIKAQLTATQRTGIHKYTFPKGKDGHLILDLVHGIYNYDGKVLWANLRV